MNLFVVGRMVEDVHLGGLFCFVSRLALTIDLNLIVHFVVRCVFLRQGLKNFPPNEQGTLESLTFGELFKLSCLVADYRIDGRQKFVGL